MRLPSDKFHAHLDICEQCREHPFDLCREGSRLLEEAASDSVTVDLSTLPNWANIKAGLGDQE